MLPMFDPRARPVLREDLILREEDDGELIIYNPATDALHSVKGVGAVFVRRCDGRATLGTISRELSADHAGLAGPYGWGMLHRFVDSLVERGVLSLEHPPS